MKNKGEMFGGIRKNHYLCTRTLHMTIKDIIRISGGINLILKLESNNIYGKSKTFYQVGWW